MKYLLKVWLSTLIIPPIIFWIIISIMKNENISAYPLMLPILITTIIMGFIFSIPLIIISVILNNYMNCEMWKMKMVLNLIYVGGIIGITAFLDKNLIFLYSKESILPLAYLIIISLSIWIFKYSKS